ncbi:MAG: AraC family transcriptional regulator [Nocardiopsaceae bacterium]|nr:AraC family transcriptional regulator [Nocardiopsaceae bacterium]
MLRPVAARYTGYRQLDAPNARHRGLPSPWLTLIVTLDDPLTIIRHPDPRQPASRHDTLLGGLLTSPALVDNGGSQSGVQIALSPFGARALLGLPAAELANLDVEASDVLGDLAKELRERALAAPDWPARFAAISGALAARVRAAPAGPGAGHPGRLRPEVGYAWRRLRETAGTVGVAALAEETGWSARYLGARFRAETGLSPKEAARVFRFDRARRLLVRGHAAGRRDFLADLAVECGYYDQAHLAREFRDLAGCPPSVWLAEEFRFVQAASQEDWE